MERWPLADMLSRLLFLAVAAFPAGAVPVHTVLPDDLACSDPAGCGPLNLLEKTGPADPVVVVCSERHADFVARGLGCALPSDESRKSRRLNDDGQPQASQGDKDEPSPALPACGNGSEVHIVADEQNGPVWRRTVEGLVANGTKGATLIGIGREAFGAFKVLQQGRTTLSDFFGRVALITLYPLEESSYMRKSEATCPTSVECFFFDIFPGVFAAGVSAGLPAWTQQAVAILTDRKFVDSNPYESDLTFKAFVSGVKYASPELKVITTQVSTDINFQKESFNAAVVAEVRTLMKDSSVIYLDVFSESALIAVLHEMHESAKGMKSKWVILPPWFRPYTDEGAPQEGWNRVVFNSVSVDWARAVRDIIAQPDHAAKLTIQDGYVTTLWTRLDLDNSLWMNDFTGVFDKQANDLKGLSRFPCGQRDRSIFEQMNVSWKGLTAPEQSTQRATCNVMAKTCFIKEARDLKLKQGKIPQNWPDMKCNPTEGSPKRCQGLPIEQDSCSAPDLPTHDGDASPVLKRRIGVGLSVNNIADIDIARGTFFVDFDVRMLEDNNKYANDWSEVLSSTVCQGMMGMGHGNPVNITSAEQFYQLFQVVGADRYATVTPWTGGIMTLVNFKGNIFFKPKLWQWPFDQQELVIELVPNDFEAKEIVVSFCILKTYTTVAPTVRLADVSEGPWAEWPLMMNYSVRHTCAPPFENPTGEGCDRMEHNNDDVSCWCMRGKTRRHVAKFSVLLKRPAARLFSRLFLTIFLPPIAIMILNQAVLFMYVEASDTRLSMCSSALLSCVMYHTTINPNTPLSATESTIADFLIMLCYGQNFLIWVVVLIQYIASKSAQFGQVGRWARSSLFTKSRIVLPPNYALWIFLVMFTESCKGLSTFYVLNMVALLIGVVVDFVQFAAWEVFTREGSARVTHRGSRGSELGPAIELVEPE